MEIKDDHDELDANATAARRVDGYGGEVPMFGKEIVTREGRHFLVLDEGDGPELAKVDGKWFYVDPSLPA
jgi:hypothetical protein